MKRGDGKKKRPAKTGPKPAYKRYLQKVYELSLLGLTDKEIITQLEVPTATYEYWVRNIPEFKEARDLGKQQADAKVVRALYKKATGFEQKEIVAFPYKGTVVTKEITKYYPPTHQAAIFWLCNRQSQLWNNSHYIKHEHSGSLLHKHTQIDLSDMSMTELKALQKLGISQMVEQAKN